MAGTAKSGRRERRLLAPTLALALCCAMTVSAAQAKPRVASVTACGDQYVLMLADRDQIAAVSAEATGPLALYPDRAKGLPRNPGDLEALLAADTDLVVLEEGAKPQLASALKRMGIRTLFLPTSNDFSDIARTVRRVADALGQPARGAAVAAEMARRIAALEVDRAPESQRPIALFYRPDGGGGAKGTFVNALIELAGFRNLQVLAGQKGWRGIPLEAAVQTPPQIFITGFFDTQRNSLYATRGTLPVLRSADVPVVALPGKTLVCASPALVAGAEAAAAARHRYFPAAGRPG